MKSVAHLRYLRIAPRKVRLAADLVRGKNVLQARRRLAFASKRAALPVLKTLNSAVASAKNNFQAEESNLYVAQVMVNEGPKLKRFRARAQGRAYPIQKKTSHITLVVEELQAGRKAAVSKRAKGTRTEKRTAKIPRTPKRPTREFQEAARTTKQANPVQKMFRRKSV